MPPLASDKLLATMYRKHLHLARRFDANPLLKALLTAPIPNGWDRTKECIVPLKYKHGEFADDAMMAFARGPCYLPTPPASVADFVRAQFRAPTVATARDDVDAGSTSSSTSSVSAQDLFTTLRRLSTAKELYDKLLARRLAPPRAPDLQAKGTALGSTPEDTLLAAHPALVDAPFSQAVVWLAGNPDPDPQATLLFGFILNKITIGPAAQRLREQLMVLAAPFLQGLPLHYGGPVGGALALVHPHERMVKELGDNAFAWGMGDGWYLQLVTEPLVKFLHQNEGQLDPAGCRVIAGTSLWHRDQLQMEVDQHRWVQLQLQDAPMATLFGGPQGHSPEFTHSMWSRVMAALGGEFAAFARMPLLTTVEIEHVQSQLRFYQALVPE